MYSDGRILQGDALSVLKTLDDESINSKKYIKEKEREGISSV